MLAKSRFITSQKGLLATAYKMNKRNLVSASAAAVPQNLPFLPELPVPKLSQTMEKYLKSVEPFLNENELNQTKKLIAEFQSEDGLGQKLQKLLVQKAKESENWLSDWWLENAYLAYRDPVVVYTSPGLVYPVQKFKSRDDMLIYAADTIVAALDYKLYIDSGKVPLEKMGKDPLDMNQYKKIFGTCRTPGVKIDNLEFNPQSKHIVIVRNNNFFKLPVLNEFGQILDTDEVITSLQEIVHESEKAGPPVGVLTAENRTNWGKAYQNFILDLTNLKSVREIQTSLFLVCLDKPLPKCGNENDLTRASKQLIHGGGSKANSGNRWFDKTVQFVVSEDGVAGLTYEHSPAEGGPIAVMSDYIVDYMKKGTCVNQASPVEFFGEPEKLYFNVDEKLQRAIDNANTHVDKLVENLDLDAVKFDYFGKELVKSHKISPDSFIQMALQYAFYRIHKVPGAQYESGATRKYIHGRTETIRSCSNESIAFAKAMLDNSKSDAEKVETLKKAIEAHKKYSVEAVNGFGVDRHLLGLKLIAMENQLPLPELFRDPSYTRSVNFRMSTSQVAVNCDGFMCYGAAVPDGYALCYNPRKDDINFAAAAFTEHPDTSATKLREAVECSLVDMGKILAHTQKSKL